ncbi:MAG: hypothetical protein OXG79_00120 [Chloroflexi bacterium]|nr:hypothetical protein [Chloroflexota bacterium]
MKGPSATPHDRAAPVARISIRAVAVIAILGAMLGACDLPGVPATTARPPATVTPDPTPTWTPIPFATATPTPTPSVTATPTPAEAPVPPTTPVASPAVEPSPAPTTSPTIPPTPTGPVPPTDAELLALLPGPGDLPDDPALTVLQPGAGEITADVVGLADQFLDPLVVRRGDPFLLALVLVGSAVEPVDVQVVAGIIERPDTFLESLALGLVQGLQAAARAANVTELEPLSSPGIGTASGAARTRVASGGDIYEARLAVAVRDGVAGMVIQIARIDDTAELLDAVSILRRVVETDLVRG